MAGAMTLIRTAAEDAAALAAQQEAAAEQATRDALIAEARSAVEALPAPDGKLPLTGKGKELTVPHADVDVGLVVLSDGDVALAFRDGSLLVVELVDGGWTERSGPIGTLAELGEALRS